MSQTAVVIHLMTQGLYDSRCHVRLPITPPAAGAVGPFASSFATSYGGVVSFLAVADDGSVRQLPE